MQCCLVVDRQGNVLRPAIIWADQRAQKQAMQLCQVFDETEAYQLLGHQLSPAYSIEKLMWIRENEPDIYEKTYHMYHQREDYIRASLEGVAMNLALILQAYRKYLDIDRMILTVGGAKGDIVAQILADVLEASLVRPDHVEEATSIAAAVIAGVGCGIYEDFEAIHKFLKFRTPVEPDLGKKTVYDRQKKTFDDVYQALVPFYKEMNSKKTI